VQRRYFKYAVVVLLALWAVGIANYWPGNITFGFGFGEASISLQIVALLFVAFYYGVNRSRANKLFWTAFSVKPDSAKARRIQREEIEKFKQTFRGYSSERLRAITAEKKLVREAVAAAQELLISRGE